MFKISPTRKVVMSALLLAIPLGLLGIFLLIRSQLYDVNAMRAMVERSIERRNYLQLVLTEHLDVETGQRGFVLTGEREFLEPYNAALTRVAATFAGLEKAERAGAEKGVSTSRLRALSREKLAFAAATVRLTEQGDLAGARRMVAGGRGKQIMDAIRDEVAQIDRVEAARLAWVTHSRDLSRSRVEKTIYAMLTIFALLLAVVSIVTGNAIRGRWRQYDRANRLNERQQAILNGTVDGLLVLDRDGYILETNSSIERLFGFDEEHLVGKHNTYLMARKPDLEVSMGWLRTVGPAGRSGAGTRIAFTGLRSDGTMFNTDVAVSRISSDSDASYVAIIQDITDRKRVEAMKTEFVSTVSHELRTPLTSIGGSLGLLAAGAAGPLGDKANRLIQIAHSNCERLIRLINDMLDIEKIESGNMRFDMKRLRAAPLIDRVVAANAQFAASHAVTLSAEHAAWPLTLEGDADRLDQLLTNLVSNAIKHSPTGSAVEVAAQSNAGLLRIEVRDRGAGIPVEFRQRIFGKFAMADSSNSRTRAGTGLGLSIAREIAQKHGGEIGYFDRPGGGTVFHVDLPLICEDAIPTRRASGLPTVLHVDDDQDCLEVVAGAFANRAEVISVPTLDEARAAIAAQTFAAAIVDVGMTPDSGLNLVPALRLAMPGAPVLLFTATDGPDPLDTADAVVVKSRSSLAALVEKTMDLIGGSNRRDAA